MKYTFSIGIRMGIHADGDAAVDYEVTGETKHFDGHLFEPVVFDDSVREFMRLK